MADKFTINMHKENMRKIIRPQPAGSMMERLSQAVQRRKLPITPKTKGIR